MFTGIIEDIGTVKSIEIRGASGRITIKTALDTDCMTTGESIAVDGACLTVTGVSKGVFKADLSAETKRVTTLGGLKPGAAVNLEKAVTLAKPLGGHLVTGHVDGVGAIKRKTRTGDFMDIEFTVPAGLLVQVVKKGPVAVDGISLTVAEINPDGFTASVVPHTLERTTLSAKPDGFGVNIETDIIAKYVERFLRTRRPEGITEEFLSEHGFLKRG